MAHKWKIILAISVVLLVVSAFQGCRRVTLVGDSLFGCARDVIVNAIDSNNGNSWVYTEYIQGGCTSYSNPINQEIYSHGTQVAFSLPDTVVFSFATNEMIGVALDQISMESAIQSMQTLINQAVTSGSMCVVMLESSHRFYADLEWAPRFGVHMDDWFDHWHQLIGDNSFLGAPYKFLIADISEEVHADPATYLSDGIHFTPKGADLAAAAIVEQINQCPQGRWIFGTNTLEPEASFPPNPYQ